MFLRPGKSGFMQMLVTIAVIVALDFPYSYPASSPGSVLAGVISVGSVETLADTLMVERLPADLVLIPGQPTSVTLRVTGNAVATCQGAPQQPVDAMLVFDISSSAGIGPESNWAETQNLTRSLLDLMEQPVFRTIVSSQTSRIGLITSREDQSGLEPLLLAPLTDQYQELRALIDNTIATGDTDLAGGIRLAIEQLDSSPSERARAIILMLHDSVVVTESTMAAVQEAERGNLPVYVVINSKNITENLLTRPRAEQLVPTERIFIDPIPEDLRRLFIQTTQGRQDLAAHLLRIEEQVQPGHAVTLMAPTHNGLLQDNRVIWNIPTINQGEVIEVSYQMQVPENTTDTVSISTRLDYIDCNGLPFSNIAPAIQIIPETQVSPVMPDSTPAPTEPPVPPDQPESTLIPPLATVAVPDENDSVQPILPVLQPDQEEARSPIPPLLLLPLPWWLWILIVIPLLFLLLWLMRSMFGWFGRKKPPTDPPDPVETPGSSDLSDATDLADSSDWQLPGWIDKFDRGDPLTSIGQPLYESPRFKDTLIIGVGAVGGMVLDQMAAHLNRRFTEYPNVTRNVCLLWINVQPSTGKKQDLLYQPVELRDHQVIFLQPDLADIDAALKSEREQYAHLWWWEGNHADDYGRACGRMALFQDLRHGTDSSIVWQKLRRALEDLRDPAVWIVATTFDDIGSGMAVDLARITRLVRQQAQAPSLLLALPAQCWGGSDLSEQTARSVATLREIDRLMRNADVPFVYNPSAGQNVLDQWLQSASAIDQVYLFDATQGGNAECLDLNAVKAEAGIAALMTDCLLTLIESSVYQQVQQQFTPLSQQAGRLINSDRHAVIGSMGCFSLYLPIDQLRLAVEHRAIHELLFSQEIGLLPAGHFTPTATWQSQPVDLIIAASTASVASDVDRFMNSMGVNTQKLATLNREQCLRFRQKFLRRFVAQTDEYLNGTGIGTVFENRCGGLSRTYTWARELHQRLMRVRQPDIQQCARWTAGLRDALQHWLEALIGSLDEFDQPVQSPLLTLTLNNYERQRHELQELKNSPVRQPLLGEQLDVPFYQRAIYDTQRTTAEQERGAMARMLRRVGWWCQAPETSDANATWKVQLLILPAGYEEQSQPMLANYAYDYQDCQSMLQALHALAQIFSRQVIGRNNSNPLTTSLASQDPKKIREMALPRLAYQDTKTSTIVGQLRGQMYVTALPTDNANTQFIDNLRSVSAELSMFNCGTTNPYACRVLRIIYPIPLGMTTAYSQDAWTEYYSSRQLHVFSPEQYAVELEQQRTRREKRVRFSADLVQLFNSEDYNLAELFGLCWIYGLLHVRSSGQYALQLADEQQPDPLLTGQATPIWVTLNDLVAYQHQADRLKPLHRNHRNRVVQRIQQALDRKRKDIGDRSSRSTYLDQFRANHLQPLYDETQPAIARDLASFIDMLIDRERRQA